jgi:hypothetical protein
MMYKFIQTAEINFCYIYSSKTRSEMMLLSKEQPYKTRNEPSCRCALGCALISFEADLADSPTSIRSSDLPSSLLSLSSHLLRRLASASAIHRLMISVSPSDVRSVTVGAEAIVQVDGPASTTVDSPDDSTTVNSPASMCRQGVLMPMPAKEGNKAMEMVVIDIKRGTEWAPYFCLYLCR